MSSNATPRPYIHPYLGGFLLGLVLFLAFFFTGGGLGASGALTHVQVGVLRWFAQEHVNRVAYFADVAGGHRNPWASSEVYMLAGIVLGGFLSGLLNHRAKLELRKGPRISAGGRLLFAFIGGAFMGYGARMARGCTSGQGLSGGATLAVGSWAFMLALFGAAYALAWFFRRLWL